MKITKAKRSQRTVKHTTPAQTVASIDHLLTNISTANTMKIFKGKPSKRTTKQKTPAQIVASIDHLLIQILLLLPIKSLTRFKLVSKHWHSLITNPKFCRLFRHPNPNPALGLLYCISKVARNLTIQFVPFSRDSTPTFKKLDFTKDPCGIRILQSCNGLLLCSSSRDHPIFDFKYYVYNPTTSQFSTIPNTQDNGNGRVYGMSLAFDPAKSPYYKVVCDRAFQLDSGKYQNQIEIYSSETGLWRLSGQPFVEEVNLEHGVYWNGSIHWINEGREGCSSLYFNVEDESLKALPAVPGRVTHYFEESYDHLHYIEIIGPQIEFDVYEMKRDYSEWFVKYQVDLSPVAEAFPEIIRDGTESVEWYGYLVSYYHYTYSILFLVRGEQEEDAFLILQIPGKVIRYNLVNRTVALVHEFEGLVAEVNDQLMFSGVRTFQYVESLCCV